MRHTVLLQDGWRFAKAAEIPAAFPESWQPVTLPHTWNAADGTDGGQRLLARHRLLLPPPDPARPGRGRTALAGV